MSWCRRWVPVAAALALAAGATGCGDDGPSGEDVAATADTVCSLLRRWNDDLGEVINATSESITDDDDPTTANGVLVDGFDEMISVAEGHVGEVDHLDLPDTPDRDQLLADLQEGAERSLATLEEERGEAAALEPIGVEQQRGALGGAFTGVERATSVLEPQVARYDEDLRRAFADDDGCANVVQPTG
jgi:hypothetical protein